MQVVVEEEAWFAILYGSLVLSTKTGALMFRKDDLSLSCFLALLKTIEKREAVIITNRATHVFLIV